MAVIKCITGWHLQDLTTTDNLLIKTMQVLHSIGYSQSNRSDNHLQLDDICQHPELNSLFMKGDPVYKESELNTIQIESRRIAHNINNRIGSMGRFFYTTYSLILLIPMLTMPVQCQPDNIVGLFILINLTVIFGLLLKDCKKRCWVTLFLGVLLIVIIELMFPGVVFTLHIYSITVLVGLAYYLFVIPRNIWLIMCVASAFFDPKIASILAEVFLVSAVAWETFNVLQLGLGPKYLEYLKVLVTYFVMVLMPIMGTANVYIGWSVALLFTMRILYAAFIQIGVKFTTLGVVILVTIVTEIYLDTTVMSGYQDNQLELFLDMPPWLIVLIVIIWTNSIWFNIQNNPHSTGVSYGRNDGITLEFVLFWAVAILEVSFTWYNRNSVDWYKFKILTVSSIVWYVLKHIISPYINWYRYK